MIDLRILRIRMNLTQTGLATLLNVSQQYISAIETGRTKPSKKIMNLILALMEREK